MGLFLTLFGLGFALGPLTFLWSDMAPLFALFAIPFVIAGVAVFAVGLWLLIGYSEILVTNLVIAGVERAGPFWFRRKRPNSGVTKVLVRRMPMTVSNRQVEGFGSISIEFEKGKPFAVGFLYPTELLQALARELIEELGLSQGNKGEVEVVVEKATEFHKPAVPVSLDPPDGTPIAFSRNQVGLLLEIPGKGFRGTGCFLLVFGVLWCTIIGAITFGFLSGDTNSDSPTVLFLVPFWAIGIGVLLLAFHLARRRAMLAVVNGNLLIKRTGLFGSKSREIRADEIRSIEVGQTKYQVNDRNLPLLHIETGGKPVRLLDGREAEEIAWIVAVLRDGLAPKSQQP